MVLCEQLNEQNNSNTTLYSSNCIVSYYTIRYNTKTSTKMYGSPEPIKLRCIAVDGWDSIFII